MATIDVLITAAIAALIVVAGIYAAGYRITKR